MKRDSLNLWGKVSPLSLEVADAKVSDEQGMFLFEPSVGA